jgi:dihydroorotase
MSKKGLITPEKIVQKMCHAPADLFRIKERGYIREGYFADLVLIDPKKSWVVSSENVLYKCGWSPFDGVEFSHKVDTTFVNGKIVFADNRIQGKAGQRITFEVR